MTRRSPATLRSRLLIVATLAPLLSCGLLGSGRHEQVQEELNRNHRLWEAQGAADYRYVARRSCYCPGEVVARVTVDVRGGGVASQVYEESGAAVDATYSGLWPSLDGVFDIVQDAIDRDAAKIEVKYDRERGFPRSISIDYMDHAIDEELSFTADAFEELP